MHRPICRILAKTGPIITLLVGLIFGTSGWAESPVVYESHPQRLVLLPPSGGLRGDIEFVRGSWANYAIAVITAKEKPKCAPSTASDGTVTKTIYCSVRIQYSELLDGNPNNRVRILYWYLEESDIVNIAPGDRRLVFLVPTLSQESYNCTIMMLATKENLAVGRAALGEIDS